MMVRDRVQGEAIESDLESFESVLTRDDLRMLWRFYFILVEFKIKLAGPKERELIFLPWDTWVCTRRL